MTKTERRVVVQADQKGLRFYASKPQAELVFDALIARLAQKGPPYHAAHVPQADQFLPANLKRGTREHALFLFVLCFWMRGGVESDTAAVLLKDMHERRPEAFIPDSYWDFGPDATRKQIESITLILKEHRLGQRVEENSRGWVYNMRKLARFWRGDPRELMKDRPRFGKLARRIIGKTTDKDGRFANEDDRDGFMFFRHKMVAMIAYFLMDSELVPMFYAPVPVDFHVLRLLVANRIIRARGKGVRQAVGVDFMKDSVQRLAREVTEWYCRKKNVSPVALCDALWLLSRNLCRFNPGNSGYVADDVRAKAARDLRSAEAYDGHPTLGFERLDLGAPEAEIPEAAPAGLTGRKRYLGLKRSPDELMKPPMVEAFRKSCGICPIQSACRYNISSGAYYTAGMLLPERERFVPPDGGQISFFGHEAFESTFRAPIDPTVRFARIELALEK